MQEAKYPNVSVPLSGQDGNMFVIIGRARMAMKRAGVERKEIDDFSSAVMSADNYDAALRTVMEWVDVQ